MTMAVSFALSRVSGAVAALVLSTAFFHAAPARADIVFAFSGDCASGCTGTATGVLTLADSYTFGADITPADFISLTYSSSSRDFELLHFDTSGLEGQYFSGGLNADGSPNSKGELSIMPPFVFPFFKATAGGFEAWTGLGRFDTGSTYTFTRIKTVTAPGGTHSGTVPEPSTWAMVLLGFAGLGFAGYRKAQRTVVADA
jgi:PEP-CTERM motif